MTPQMGDLPGAPHPRGGELGGQRTAEERAAAVPLAVGAHEGERVARVGPAPQRGVEGAVVAPAERGEVEVQQLPRVMGGGAAQPHASGDGVGRVHLPQGRCAEVRVAPGAADERDAYARVPRGGLQGAAQGRVQVARHQRFGTPGAGLFQEEPGRCRGRGSGNGLVEIPRDGRARTHRGEPNLTCRSATSGGACARPCGYACACGAGRCSLACPGVVPGRSGTGRTSGVRPDR